MGFTYNIKKQSIGSNEILPQVCIHPELNTDPGLSSNQLIFSCGSNRSRTRANDFARLPYQDNVTRQEQQDVTRTQLVTIPHRWNEQNVHNRQNKRPRLNDIEYEISFAVRDVP